MAKGYTALPPFYDFLGVHPDYDELALTILETYEASGAKESGLVLDLACGTGKLSAALMERGADVIGVDRSPEMLNVARDNCAKKGFHPLLLLQDMRALDLYGTVDVCVCATNSLNYLGSAADLKKVFALVHNFLTPGGLFFFDVNSLYKFEELYGGNSYVFENRGCFCVWQNDYNARKKECAMRLDLFERRANGSYLRKSETQKQKYFSPQTVRNALRACGLELLFEGGNYRGAARAETDADIFYLAKCIK